MSVWSVKSHRLFKDNAAVRFNRTPNQGGVIQPTILVLHDTAGPSLSSAENWFKNPNSKASAHLIIDRDGSMVQMGDFNRRLWHAGRSVWKGKPDLNNRSIGIEIVNPGRLNEGPGGTHVTAYGKPFKDPVVYGKQKFGGITWSGWWATYTEAQIEILTGLCAMLVDRYPIQEIVTHWMISPGRKVDTNPAFPLDLIRERAFGHAADKNDPRPHVQSGDGGPEVRMKASVNMRRYPSFYSTNIVQVLTEGTVASLLGVGEFVLAGDQIPVDMMGKQTWQHVRIADGTEGWVHASLTTPVV